MKIILQNKNTSLMADSLFIEHHCHEVNLQEQSSENLPENSVDLASLEAITPLAGFPSPYSGHF